MSKKKRHSKIHSGKSIAKLPNSIEQQQPATLHQGYHQPVFYSYFKQLGDRSEVARCWATDNVIRALLSVLNPPKAFSNLESGVILESFKKSLEDRIKEIISKHSVYYWMHLYRRLAPENTFGHLSLVSVRLYRETMEAAFAKYGSLQIGNDLLQGTEIDPDEIMSGEVKRILNGLGAEFKPPPGIYIKEFSFSQFVELLSLERLVSEFCQVVAMLRRVYKGGSLVIENVKSYYVQNDNITELLIQSLDRRSELFSGHFTERGMPIDSSGGASPKYVCFLPIYNVYRVTLKEYPQDLIFVPNSKPVIGNRVDFAPNFLLAPQDMEAYYLHHEFLSKDFADEYGFTFKCFVQCMMSLSLLVIAISRETGVISGIEFMQRAYKFYTSTEHIVADINSMIESMIRKNLTVPHIEEYQPSPDEIARFLMAFTLNDRLTGQIDLATRGPRPLVIETFPNSYILDYSALPSILHNALSLKEADWTEKGIIFEDYVIEKLTQKGFRLWEHQKVLKANDDTETEIDISFLLGTALFICECRSVSRSKAYERGERQALDFRREKFNSALETCDRRADWLAKHRRGRNFEIPQGVDIVIPIAVSPFVEYIWSANEMLWLTKEIPRVCTPDELATLTSRDVLAKIVGRPFVRYIVVE
jgi:hypothetical protein